MADGDLFELGEAGSEPGSGTLVLALAPPPVPDVIEQSPVLEVYVAGSQHTLPVAASAEFGFDMRVARASVTVAADVHGEYGAQPEPAPWQLVEIRVGPTEAEKYTRFYGYFVKLQRSVLPAHKTWELRGRLHRAVWYRNLEEGGTDLSNGGAGRSDDEMVRLILDRCGVPYTVENIGGTGALWGTIGYNADKKLNPFVWKEGETGLDCIERIDEVSTQVVGGQPGAFRTYEGIDGQIYRTHQTAIPEAASEFAALVQGQHILDGADSTINERDHVANRARVDGWHSGESKLTYTAVGTNAILPPGQESATEATESQWLEREAGTAGQGRSCQQQAEYRLAMVNSTITRGSIPTYRGDRLEPGHTVRVLAPETLQLDAHYWLEHISWSFDRGRWTQTLGVAQRAAA
jgi:hypothetical protein